MSEKTFEQAKTPVWAELCVANRQKRESDCCMLVSQNPPSKVVYHAIVLILPAAVIGMEENIFFTKTIMRKEVVESTYNSISTFSAVTRFVCEKIDLLRNPFTHYTKDRALSWSEEVNGSWLFWVRRIINLLCVVKGVVDLDVFRIG